MLFLFALTIAATCGNQVYGDQQLVDKLNADYQAYDPDDDSSTVGVWVHALEQGKGEAWLADCNPGCGNLYNELPIKVGTCHVSALVLNAKNGHMQEDWLAKKMNTKNVEVEVYPLGVGRLFPYTVYHGGGVIYGSAVEQALKCAYPFDGASVMRPNNGCGCPSMFKLFCPSGNPNWSCPTTFNTCSDKDPLSHFWNPRPIEEDSAVLTACQCTNMGMTEKDNPIWRGFLGQEYRYGVPKCMWQGPQFFNGIQGAQNGTGRNELRQALRQQYNFRKEATLAWNEAVLDGRKFNSQVEQNPAETITAFYYLKHKKCDVKCRSAIHEQRDMFVKKYGVQVPVIMLDPYNGTAPFTVEVENVEEHLAKLDDAEKEDEMVDARAFMSAEYLRTAKESQSEPEVTMV